MIVPLWTWLVSGGEPKPSAWREVVKERRDADTSRRSTAAPLVDDWRTVEPMQRIGMLASALDVEAIPEEAWRWLQYLLHEIANGASIADAIGSAAVAFELPDIKPPDKGGRPRKSDQKSWWLASLVYAAKKDGHPLTKPVSKWSKRGKETAYNVASKRAIEVITNEGGKPSGLSPTTAMRAWEKHHSELEKARGTVGRNARLGPKK